MLNRRSLDPEQRTLYGANLQPPAGYVFDAAVATTSNNSNAVATMGEIADGSYNSTQMQNVINKIDELILALRRS